MEMERILQTYSQKACSASLNLALSSLKEGNCVALPTETVYGLAAAINQPKAVEKLRRLKNRPKNSPFILHISQNQVNQVCSSSLHPWIKGLLPQLIHHFWPGPLTLLLPAPPSLQAYANSHGLVAYRCPRHRLFQKVLEQLKVPLIAPSANQRHQMSSLTAQAVLKQFPKEDFLILDGNTHYQIESTILGFEPEKETLLILRPGAIGFDEIQNQFKTPLSFKISSQFQAAGQNKRHYQPQTPCSWILPKQILHLQSPSSSQIYLLGLEQDLNQHKPFHPYQSLGSNLKEACFQIYSRLSQIDTTESNHLLFIKGNWTQKAQSDPWGLTLFDRIERITAGKYFKS